MTSDPGIEPAPHWWKASALTTAPTLLPVKSMQQLKRETEKEKK